MKNRKICILMAMAAISTVVLCACGEETESGRGKHPTEEPTQAAAPDDAQAPDDKLTPDEDKPDEVREDHTIRVDNLEDLINAIDNNAEIELAPGTYNITDYLNTVWASQGEQWNDDHRYAEIQEVYDGLQLVIKGVDGLEIKGGTDNFGDTVLLAEPRYAAVLTFDTCDNLRLADMTMGHTETGECWGSVIDLFSCQYSKISNMDLFGCGVIGLNMEDCGNLYCAKTTIRECSMGPLYNSGSAGTWTFDNCQFVDSENGGYFGESRNLTMEFKYCTFGDRETENFMFRSDTVTDHCTWGNPNNYPDTDPWEVQEYGLPEEFHVDDMSECSFDEEFLANTTWYGFTVTDEKTGATTEEETSLYFDENGTGYFDDENAFHLTTWEMDTAGAVKMTVEDNGDVYELYLYAGDGSDCYLKLDLNGKESWFY